MRVDTHNALRDPHRIEATQVVVRDRYGEPVVVILEPGPGRIVVLQTGDPGFADACRVLGVGAAAPCVRAAFPKAPLAG